MCKISTAFSERPFFLLLPIILQVNYAKSNAETVLLFFFKISHRNKLNSKK